MDKELNGTFYLLVDLPSCPSVKPTGPFLRSCSDMSNFKKIKIGKMFIRNKPTTPTS